MLLVEDERKVSELVARALRAERYAVDVADDGMRGWESTAGGRIELTAAQIDETTARYEVLIREADLSYQIGVPAMALSQESGLSRADALP